MKFILLTHAREYERPSNTGTLALQHFPELCRRVPWSRVEPDAWLKQACESGEALLLFPPSDESPPAFPLEALVEEAQTPLPQQIIILDATWQEARKMVRQSPYLQQARRLSLSEASTSRYRLRRNQVDQGLCTIECIISLLRGMEMSDEAQVLDAAFDAFMSEHSQVKAPSDRHIEND
ncbi:MULTISPECIES: tRNA-uridine aminocarboxypropyltransferase [Shewanella]|uniref:tRNA-uridine aminocarboxypropyltransferase n=1 Tax=Shewanella marisflavi TaxID=260364 RepID=A0ABX5WL42_9GAMM|nr:MULTISPECIES: tRNA-uridine aminocarboxypropyltransferase [Shewanella]QDF75194.1 DTW domain-containing protein [Shewanella marisflavi]